MELEVTLKVSIEVDTIPEDEGGRSESGHVETLSARKYISSVKTTVGGKDIEISHLLSEKQLDELLNEYNEQR